MTNDKQYTRAVALGDVILITGMVLGGICAGFVLALLATGGVL